MAPAPEVVIDIRMLHHGGIGRYLRSVVPRVVRLRSDWQFTLLAPRTAAIGEEWNASNARVVACDSDIYSVGEQIELVSKKSSRDAVFWAPHFNIPLFARNPLVATIHDVAHLAVPEIGASAAKRAYARYMLGTVRRRAASVLFNSNFTRSEFERVIGRPREGEAIPLGVDEHWAAIPGARPHARPYILFVGNIKPHKNISRLLDAYDQLTSADVDLVLVGGWKGQRTVDTATLDRAARTTGVHLVETPDDATLKRYLAHAVALVVPSLYEGFGLPALEAMASGCPCIVSNAASLPEVCGDAALYFDPVDSSDIARRVSAVVHDAALRERLIARGRSRAREFSWAKTAERTSNVLERVVHATHH